MRRALGHGSARRRLPALLDGALPESEARAVRRHAGRCRRCARHLRELEASERLLRRLPASLLDPGARTPARRLAGLARWSRGDRPTPPAPALPALGALVAAAALVLLLSAAGIRPEVEPGERAVLGSAAVPESTLIPDGWR